MSGARDWIAVGPHGVYAIIDGSEPAQTIAAFKRKAIRRGHTVELVSRAEACDRQIEYVRRSNAARQAYDAVMGAPVPSPDTQGGGR